MNHAQPTFDASSPLWADLTPVYQQECDSPLCPILYDPKYSKAMDLFRALTLKPEYSARALALTTHLIRLNPSNYTIWAFRARTLIRGSHEDGAPDASSSSESTSDDFAPPLAPALKDRLAQELDFMDVLAKENMKNYQVWQHRKVVVGELSRCIAEAAAAQGQTQQAVHEASRTEWLRASQRELAFVAATLQKDAKNYHTWAYRQWVLCHFGGLPSEREADQGSSEGSSQGAALEAMRNATAVDVWAGELAYVDLLLDEDLRNNSAWNHRFFTLFASGRAAAGAATDGLGATQAAASVNGANPASALRPLAAAIVSEVQYAEEKLRIAPNNSSAWNYLRGVVDLLPSSEDAASTSAALTARQTRAQVDAFARTFLPNADADNAEAQAQPAAQDTALQAPPADVPLALQWLLDSLESSLSQSTSPASLDEAEQLVARLKRCDPMRERYWEYRRAGFHAAVGAHAPARATAA